jgi:hypothetical protein
LLFLLYLLLDCLHSGQFELKDFLGHAHPVFDQVLQLYFEPVAFNGPLESRHMLHMVEPPKHMWVFLFQLVL